MTTQIPTTTGGLQMTTTEPRCRCRHSRAAHTDEPPPTVGKWPCFGSTVGDGLCSCTNYDPRPPVWAVRRDKIDPLFMPIPGPWRVESPRGVEVFRAHHHSAALEFACSLAAVDELLARVSRLEREVFGNHPALRAPARRDRPVEMRVINGGAGYALERGDA